MIIKNVHIDGFGIFHDFHLEDLDKGLYVILGQNEAGKSTLLDFIRFTLFGYPRPRELRRPPLSGGAHGGRLNLMLRTGENVVLEREGDKNKMELMVQGKRSGDEKEWLKLIDYASRELFYRIYAITIDEITDVKSLEDTGIEDKIYNLSLGMSGVSMQKVFKELKEQSETIYSASKRNYLIRELSAEVRQTVEKIKEIQQYLPQFYQLNEEKKRLEEKKETLNKEITSLQTGKNLLGNFLKCYPHVINILRIEEELSRLPEFREYPDGIYEEITNLKSRQEIIINRIEEIRNGGDGEKPLDELNNDIQQIEIHTTILESASEIESLKNELSAYLQNKSTAATLEADIETATRKLLLEIQNISPKWNIESLKRVTRVQWLEDRIKQWKQKFESLEKQTAEIRGKISALEMTPSRLNWNTFSYVLSGILVLIGLGLGIGWNNFAGGAFILSGLLILLTRRWTVRQSPKDKLQLELSQLSSDIQKMNAEFEQFQSETLGLKGFSPDGLLDILRKIDNLQQQINSLDNQKSQLEKLRETIHNYENHVRGIAEQLKFWKAQESTGAIVSFLYNQWREEEKKKQLKEQLEDEYRKRSTNLLNAQKEFDRVTQKLEELLQQVSAENVDEFIKSYQLNQTVKQLIKEKENEIRTIETILGQGQLEKVIQFFETHDKSDVEIEYLELESREKVLTEELNGIIRRIGEIEAELRQIQYQEDLAKWMTLKESVEEQMRGAYQRWLTYQVALRVLNQVKGKFERERQPEVIQRAAHYFSMITDGKYHRIQVSMEDKKLLIFDRSDKMKTVEQLSRGTREQLLLAMRLGFIEEYEQHAEPLPVIMDEVLINFDPKRAKRTADALTEFARDRQVLFFTCHPSMVELFDQKKFTLIELNR